MMCETPRSTWSPIRRARFYLGMGYSAPRVADLFGLTMRVADAIKRGGVYA